MKTFYLNKSHKSHVNQYEVDGVTYSDLVSYETRVAYFNHNENYLVVLGWFSSTTAKHINEFIEYYGFDKLTKKEMEQKPNLEGCKL